METTPRKFNSAVAIERVGLSDNSIGWSFDGMLVLRLTSLAEALAFDDLREDQGMPAYDRATCWSHQCWADEAHLATHNY